MHQRSARRFSTGVPVSATRKSAFIAFAASVTADNGHVWTAADFLFV
jgi:hypothetical protein